MKKFVTKALLSLVMLLAGASTLRAQYIEDGLRLGTPGLGVGARSLGLGTAYTGLANDYSAMYWNPAGLGLMQSNEFSIGLSNLNYGNTATYFGNDSKTSNNSTSLNAAGFVYNVPTARGSLVFALGYGRQTEFTTGMSFSGFNPSSSIIQSWAPDGVQYGSYDLSTNHAYQLYLANLDTISGKFVSPIRDSLTQSGKILESGGINYWSFAGSIEAARDVYLGLTLNFISGSYTYNRNYYEDDLQNIYSSARYPYDVRSVSLSEYLHTDVSGFTMKFGFMYNPATWLRFGLAVKTPSWVTLRETFTSVATSDFKNGDHFVNPAGDVSPNTNEYSVQTPTVFSGGASFDVLNFTFTGDAEYTDWSQLEFSGSGTYSSTFEHYLNSLNYQVKDNLRPTLNARVGVEWNILNSGVSLRGGYAYLPSPYRNDTWANDQKYLTGGIGFLFQGAVALDLGYAYGYWDTSHLNYSGTDKNNQYFSASTSEKIITNNFIATFAYRF